MQIIVVNSYVVRFVGQCVCNRRASQHLGIEPGTFLGVLQNRRDLDGTTPVGIVETLAEDELLQMAFF